MNLLKMVGTSEMTSPPRKTNTFTDGGNPRSIPLDPINKKLFNSALFSFPRNNCDLVSVLNKGKKDHHVGSNSSRSFSTIATKTIRVCHYTKAMPQELATANMVFLVEEFNQFGKYAGIEEYELVDYDNDEEDLEVDSSLLKHLMDKYEEQIKADEEEMEEINLEPKRNQNQYSQVQVWTYKNQNQYS